MKQRSHYGIFILGLAVLTVFGSLGLGRFGYSMLLPAMQSDLGLSNAQTGAMQSANLVGYLLVVAFAGAAAARYGTRRILLAGLALVAVSMGLTALAPSYQAACFARFLTGAGGAAVNVPTMGLVGAWFAARRRGLASGIAVAGSSVGLVVTGALVPALLKAPGAGGWRTCWLVFAGLTVAIGLLAVLLVRDRPEELGLSPIGAAPEPVKAAPARASSLAWGSVYSSPHLWHLAVIYLAFGFSYIVYSTFFVQHLVRDLDLSTASAGRLWLRIGVVSMVSGLIWGALSDRWGRGLALALIFSVQGCAYLLVGLAGESLTAAYASGALFGLTAWSIPAIMAAATSDRFGPRLGSAALGLVTVVFGVGQALAPYVGGRLADAFHSIAPAFTVAGVVALVLGAGGSLLLPRRQHAGWEATRGPSTQETPHREAPGEGVVTAGIQGTAAESSAASHNANAGMPFMFHIGTGLAGLDLAMLLFRPPESGGEGLALLGINLVVVLVCIIVGLMRKGQKKRD